MGNSSFCWHPIISAANATHNVIPIFFIMIWYLYRRKSNKMSICFLTVSCQRVSHPSNNNKISLFEIIFDKILGEYMIN